MERCLTKLGKSLLQLWFSPHRRTRTEPNRTGPVQPFYKNFSSRTSIYPRIAWKLNMLHLVKIFLACVFFLRENCTQNQNWINFLHIFDKNGGLLSEILAKNLFFWCGPRCRPKTGGLVQIFAPDHWGPDRTGPVGPLPCLLLTGCCRQWRVLGVYPGRQDTWTKNNKLSRFLHCFRTNKPTILRYARQFGGKPQIKLWKCFKSNISQRKLSSFSERLTTKTRIFRSARYYQHLRKVALENYGHWSDVFLFVRENKIQSDPSCNVSAQCRKQKSIKGTFISLSFDFLIPQRNCFQDESDRTQQTLSCGSSPDRTCLVLAWHGTRNQSSTGL